MVDSSPRRPLTLPLSHEGRGDSRATTFYPSPSMGEGWGEGDLNSRSAHRGSA